MNADTLIGQKHVAKSYDDDVLLLSIGRSPYELHVEEMRRAGNAGVVSADQHFQFEPDIVFALV